MTLVKPLRLYTGGDKKIEEIRSGRQSAWGTMNEGLRHCTGGSDQNHAKEKKKKMQEGKVVVWMAREKEKDIPNWMQSSREEQAETRCPS